MEYSIQFQYKGEGDERPQDYSLHDEELIAKDGKTIPIPDVGDSISCISGGKVGIYKVLTRHFSYWRDNCYINIVVTDLPPDEFGARLKE